MDLEGMTCELFEMFKVRNGKYPRRILFFRDGVGECQLADVAAEEIFAIKKACTTLGICDSLLTFTVVNKRHHGRFFPRKMVIDTGNFVIIAIVYRNLIHNMKKMLRIPSNSTSI